MRPSLRLLLLVLTSLLATLAGGAAPPVPAAVTVAEALAEGQRRLAAEDGKGARGLFERALELARQAEDREGTAAALIGLGDTYHPQQESDKALEMYQQALAAAPQSAAARARVAYVSGIRAAGRDDLAAADEQFTITIAAARETGDRKLEAKALLARGNMALRRGDMPAAWDLYSTALPLAVETGSRSAVMLIERGLGDVEQARGHNAEALEHFEKSLSVARETHNSRITEGVLNTMGTVYLEWADYGKALQYFQEALHTETDDPSEEAYTLNNLGITYGSQGNAELGLSYFRKALPILEKLGDDYGVMRLLNNMGEFHEYGKGDHERALHFFTRALHLAQKAGDKAGEAGHWHNLGSVYESQKRYDLATSAYQKALALDESLGERNQVSQALRGLAHVHFARKQYGKAVEMADQAAKVASETGSQEIFWQARTLAGRALHALHRDEEARGAYAEAMATVEQIRSRVAGGEISREAFLEGRLEPYQRMVELLADRGEAATALVQADRAKGRTLVEILRFGRLDLASQLTPEERTAEARLRDHLTALNGEIFLARSRAGENAQPPADLEKRLQQARWDLEAFNANLYASRPALRTQRADFPEWSLEAARGLLADGSTALIEYAVQEEKTFLFVVTAEGGASPTVRLHRLPIGSRELARQVEAFRRQLGNRDLDFRAPARRLYDLLLGPAAAEIRGKRTLCIVPNGPLWELPFQALQPSGAEVLLDRHALHYAPSLAFLAELAARHTPRPAGADPAPPSLLAVGNPAQGTGPAAPADSRRGPTGLAPLPDAEREVRSLARLYGAGRSAVYTAAQASERTVKTEAGHFRVLHFATHALLDDHNPLYSSLVLSKTGPRDGEDGLLEAWEILGLHLDADLVVLSACQTARGRLRAGEGMIGMSWALAAAGSPATLASQWEVDSASTGQLMVELHRNWLAGQSRAEALRRAALAVRKQPRYRHPFYWAGFVLVGRGD